MIVAVLADTHLRSGISAALVPPALAVLEEADVILHAGDVTSAPVLDELAAYAPLHAVLGNNDTELGGLLPVVRELWLEGLHIAMVHDSGPTTGRAGRLRRRFPTADLVVFGHSHVPLDVIGIEGQRLFNPGSPTQRRQQPHATIGRLQIEGGRLLSHEIHSLPHVGEGLA